MSGDGKRGGASCVSARAHPRLYKLSLHPVRIQLMTTLYSVSVLHINRGYGTGQLSGPFGSLAQEGSVPGVLCSKLRSRGPSVGLHSTRLEVAAKERPHPARIQKTESQENGPNTRTPAPSCTTTLTDVFHKRLDGRGDSPL